MTERIAIIGAGNMGGALLRSLMVAFPLESLSVADSSAEKLSEFDKVKLSIDPKEVVIDAHYVILAVKPQSFTDLMVQLGDLLRGKVIISIMTGKSIASIKELTGSDRVVRSMPNLGVQVGEGVTVWYATDLLSSTETEYIDKIFSASGDSIQVHNEDLIDSVTPIGGSGPAYFFLLCEFLEAKAQALGFTPEQARTLVTRTFSGSAKLLAQSDTSATAWREAVTSKGGATEAALKSLSEADFAGIFSRALDSAIIRSRSLDND